MTDGRTDKLVAICSPVGEHKSVTFNVSSATGTACCYCRTFKEINGDMM